MSTLSRIKKNFMICLVTPDGRPIKSLYDVIIFESKNKKILYKSVTDGAGKVVVPAMDDLKTDRMLEIEIRQRRTDKLVKTHRMLYEAASGFHLEKSLFLLIPRR